MRWPLMVLFVAAGCAHATGEGVRAVGASGSGPASASASPSASSSASGSSGCDCSSGPAGAHAEPTPEKATATPVALPHRVVVGRTGATVDGDALAEQIRAARVVFIGEEHKNPHHHAAELELLERVYAADPSLGLGVEMLPRTAQPALDDFVAGRTDEAAFLAAVDWEKSWGFDFGFYRPLFAFCRAHGLRAYALNAPPGLAHAVAKRGPAGLTPDEKALLPELQPGPQAHRELVREAFGAHPHGRFADARFERFYLAQLVWDETMADRIAAALAGPGAPRRLLVVAGEGHVRHFATPLRVARRQVTPVLTVLPIDESELADARADEAADLFWVLSTP
jgi:uncharacterized iron-regulated protein